MQMRAAVLPVLLGATALFGNVAHAAAGDHIRFGNGGEFTPSLSLSGVYRTNNYLTVGSAFGDSDDDATVGGMHLNVRPGLALDLDSRAVILGVEAGYDMRKYFREELTNLDRYRNLNGRIQLVALPQAVVGFKVDTGITVSGRETQAVNAQDAYLQQLVSRNQATLTVRPGDAMEIDVGGVFELRTIKVPEGFATVDGAPTANLNSRAGSGLVSTFNWQFLPKTAIVAGFERLNSRWESNAIAASGQGVGTFAIEPGGSDFVLCDPDDSATGSDDCFLPVPNGVFTTFDAGIRGRFTPRLVVGAVVGFTRATFDASTVAAPASGAAMTDVEDTEGCGSRGDADGVNDELVGFPCMLNGNLEIAYEVADGHVITGGFLREAQPVFFTNYLNLNRYYVGYTGVFADRHAVSVALDANQQNYRGQVSRDDLWYRTRLDVGWGIQKWLTVDTGVWYTGRRSAGAEFPEIEYDDVNIHGGITLVY